MGFRLARIDIVWSKVSDWTLFTLPPDSNAMTKKIVISQGLEIDNLRMQMDFPVKV